MLALHPQDSGSMGVHTGQWDLRDVVVGNSGPDRRDTWPD